MLTFSLSDPVGDHSSTVDVTSATTRFNDVTGDYTTSVVLSASSYGGVYVNLNLVNGDTRPFRWDPATFFDNANELCAAQIIVLTGNEPNLTQWKVGDRVGTSGSAFGLPDGSPVVGFESGVNTRNPTGFSDSFDTLATTVIVSAAGPVDSDTDGVPNDSDNCPALDNSDQADHDLDNVGDACDLCPDFQSSNNSDIDCNGIAAPCECGDQNESGTVNVSDLTAINAAIFGRVQASPLCDTNNDNRCNVSDIVGANRKIFGHPAYCSRYPPPGP
jgi:hypothetical protein